MPVPSATPVASEVSVALCTYQGQTYIAEQLASILGQQRLPGEIVVSDDGSHDDTVALVEIALAEARGRGIVATLIRNEKQSGVTGNFEAAMMACTRDIIILCDQDDRWAADRVSEVEREFADHPGATLLQGDALLIDGRGRETGAALFATLGVSERELAQLRGGNAFDALLRRNLATGATMAIRRTLLQQAFPFPREWLHDEWLAILAASAGGLAVSKRPTVFYRQHGLNQVGVTRSTFRYRVRRMLTSEPERNAKLALRSDILQRRLAEIGADAEILREARAKAAFETQRASFDSGIVARIPEILRLARGGGYQRYASQGRLDVLRDLLRRASAV